MLVQTNRHGLPMPRTPTAFLAAALVALVWAGLMFAAGFRLAAAVVAGVAVACASISLAKRKAARAPR